MSGAGWVAAIPGGWMFLGLLGLCLGSFLNVVIYRLPLGRSLARPRSACPACSWPIAPYDNIPVLSWLVLRGRCRHCRARIPIRYPIVETLGAACVLVAAAVSGTPGGAAVRAAFLLSMVVVTLIDYDHRIIPDEISLGGIPLGLLTCTLIGVTRLDALIGAAAGAGSLMAIALLYTAVRKVDGMGGGDVKLAGTLGAFLGWQGVLLTLIIGSLLGSIIGIVLMATGRGSGKTALPFGTFLAPAAALILLVGPRIWAWYAALLHPTAGGTW
jgi:leader peptidase (prepilin peptidase) / N-methyltransferase